MRNEVEKISKIKGEILLQRFDQFMHDMIYTFWKLSCVTVFFKFSIKSRQMQRHSPLAGGKGLLPVYKKRKKTPMQSVEKLMIFFLSKKIY